MSDLDWIVVRGTRTVVGLTGSSSARVDPTGRRHVYRSWSLINGYNNPIHSENVIDHEIDLFLAEHELKTLTTEQHNQWVWGINMTSENNKVNCPYCLEWIHA